MARKNWICAAVVVGVGLAGSASGAVGTVLLVVVNSGGLTAQESARKTMIEGWGYTVTPISASASAGTFDSSCRSSSCAYICCTITASTLSTKLVNQTIPVICEIEGQSDELGFSSSTGSFTSSAIDIVNTSHYITSVFSSGSRTLYTANQPLRNLSGTLGSYTSLAERVSSSSVCMAVFERGGTMQGGSTYTAGRRVYMPGASSGVDITDLNTDGQTLMQRSIEWCLMPIAHWKMDEGTGSTVADSNGGHNGTRSGATWTSGKLSGALSFNGTSDYVSVANHAAFQVTSALTLAGWIRATSFSSGTDANVIIRKGDANPNNWQLSVCDGKIEVTLDMNDTSGIRGNTTVTTGVWHHIAATWDGVNCRIYLNGVLDNTPTAKAAPIGTDTRTVFLGGRSGSTDVINGKVDDVRFYNRALTAAEIAALAAVSPTVMSWENVAP